MARDGGDATTINYYIIYTLRTRVVKTAPSRSGYERVATGSRSGWRSGSQLNSGRISGAMERRSLPIRHQPFKPTRGATTDDQHHRGGRRAPARPPAPPAPPAPLGGVRGPGGAPQPLRPRLLRPRRPPRPGRRVRPPLPPPAGAGGGPPAVDCPGEPHPARRGRPPPGGSSRPATRPPCTAWPTPSARRPSPPSTSASGGRPHPRFPPATSWSPSWTG